MSNFDSKNTTFLDRKIDLKPLKKRGWGFGITLAGHRKSYYKIPENIRIWYGDDYLVQMNNEHYKTNYIVDDLPIFTMMSTTSNLEEFEDVKNIDNLMYDRFVKTKGKNNG